MAHILKKEPSMHFRYSVTVQANTSLFFVRHYHKYTVEVRYKVEKQNY